MCCFERDLNDDFETKDCALTSDAFGLVPRTPLHMLLICTVSSCKSRFWVGCSSCPRIWIRTMQRRSSPHPDSWFPIRSRNRSRLESFVSGKKTFGTVAKIVSPSLARFLYRAQPPRRISYPSVKTPVHLSLLQPSAWSSPPRSHLRHRIQQF